MADDVAAFCAELGIERSIVFGHSFGGYVALPLAIRHPALLGGLILGSTSPYHCAEDLDLLEQLAGKNLRELAVRLATDQASEEDMRLFNEELFPRYDYPPATPTPRSREDRPAHSPCPTAYPGAGCPWHTF